MAARLRLLWERVHSSYWFLPGLLLATAAGLAFVATWLDRNMDQEWLQGLTGVFAGGPEGARAVLGATATAVLGVAGTTFSITIAVLSLTSSQFGPRLLRSFLKDTGNQLVLGTFIGTFLYSLLVLRTVRSTDESPFVPHLAVTLGLVLAVLSVCMLVYFIQHIVNSIQASRIIGMAEGSPGGGGPAVPFADRRRRRGSRRLRGNGAGTFDDDPRRSERVRTGHRRRRAAVLLDRARRRDGAAQDAGGVRRRGDTARQVAFGR